MSLLEDDPMEDNVNRRWPQWKTTYLKDELPGRQPNFISLMNIIIYLFTFLLLKFNYLVSLKLSSQLCSAKVHINSVHAMVTLKRTDPNQVLFPLSIYWSHHSSLPHLLLIDIWSYNIRKYIYYIRGFHHNLNKKES